MQDAVKLGLVGCGYMGRRHVFGYKELKEQGLNVLELEAVCDIDVDRAEALAEFAYSNLGKRPRVYTSLSSMLAAAEGNVEALDIVSLPKTHHTLTCEALQSGVNVCVEKPMAITVKACRLMVEAARKSGRVLAVAENYRRDPLNRIVQAAIAEEVIGKPSMVFETSVGGGDNLFMTVWRHMRHEGGLLLDVGVHITDILRYFLGDVEEVYGVVGLLEKRRHRREKVGEALKVVESITPTADDMSMAVLRFRNGVIGHWSLIFAAHGEGLGHRLVYGSRGSINCPPDRSGKPIRLSLDDGVKTEEALKPLASKALDPVTSKLFPGVTSEYQLSFPEIDRKLIAIELYDFIEAIREKRKPEVDGLEGLKAVALLYAICESSVLGEPVKVRDVEEGLIKGYQEDIDAGLGL